MFPRLMLVMLLLCASNFVAGCSTWGTTVPMGSKRYQSVPREHVVILFEPPQRPYEQIGIVSSIGGVFASEGDMYRKMQMSAARLGADAIIVRGQGTVVNAGSGVTVVQNQSVNNYWDYPKTSAIAIKYR
jgi:hypothetical protein